MQPQVGKARLPFDPSWTKSELVHLFDRRDERGRPYIYCDYAATSWPLDRVTRVVTRFNGESRSNVHRGRYELSLQASQAFDSVHSKVAGFFNAEPKGEIAFVGHNATMALNQVALSLGASLAGKRRRANIIISDMEHSSNLLPWLNLARRNGYEVRWIPLTPDYQLDMKALERLIDRHTLVVAVTHASNVLGTINDIESVSRIAHDRGALVVVDGVQAAPHLPVDVKKLDCDFYVASGHKMFSPHVGIVYGKSELMSRLEPALIGGGTIYHIEHDAFFTADVPSRFEPGTPDVGNVIGLGELTDFLFEVGMKVDGDLWRVDSITPLMRRHFIQTAMEAIRDHEMTISERMVEGLMRVKGLKLYGLSEAEGRVPTFSINVGEMLSDQLAMLLGSSYEGIDVPTKYIIEARSGCHCAYPTLKSITGNNIRGTARISLGWATTADEVDRILDTIETIARRFGTLKSDVSKSAKLHGLRALFIQYAVDFFLSPKFNVAFYKRLLELQNEVLTGQYNQFIIEITGRIPDIPFKGFFWKSRLKRALNGAAMIFAKYLRNGVLGNNAGRSLSSNVSSPGRGPRPWCYRAFEKESKK